MFDFVRKHNRIMQIMLFLLIFPSFVLFGIDGYNRMRDKGAAVAKVDGVEILQSDWDQAHKSDVERVRASRPNVDLKMLDTPEAHFASLERMVRERVLAAAAAKFHITTSDAQLARSLESDPTIAQLRKPDGSLDIARYQQLLAGQNMTPAMFEARVRADLSARQVQGGILETGFVPAAIANQDLDAFFQKRAIQVAPFKPADFVAKVNPTEAELEQFYKDHPAQFQAQDQATIDYLVLDVDAIAKTITPNEDDLKTYYKENIDRIAGPEQRRASHILINAGKDMPQAEREKAKARAEELLAEVRKAPNSFAELAKKNSQDPGSAPKGGDLDYFGRGAMVKPFEQAVFAMKVGDISDVVESEFGYHIIKLTDIKEPKKKSYEEMRPELEAQVKKQLAQRKFAEEAESFTNGVYEQSDSLKPVAEKLKLSLQTAANIGRQPMPGAAGVLANPKFLAAVFSADAIEKKRNTEAVELGSNQLAAAHVTSYSPAHVRPFAEVKDGVRAQLIASRSADLAKQDGMSKLQTWKSNPASASYPAEVTISRQDMKGLPPAVAEAALRADSSALPQQLGVDLGAGGYAIVKVVKIVPRDKPEPAAAKQEQEQVNQQWTTAEGQAYYELLKQQFKVKILVPKPVMSLP